MQDLSDFRILETLYEREQTLVLRALNTKNNMPVVLKRTKSHLTSVRRICFFNDYYTAKSIQANCVIPPIDFVNIPDGPTIVYPDKNCVTLKQLSASRLLQIEEITHLFYQTADALAQIHARQWLHLNLSLDHILFNADTNTIYLIDWQFAIQCKGLSIDKTQFSFENMEIIPPELTGLTNDKVDIRTDLYALGCLFYALYTHSPVFREKVLDGQIQAHVSNSPIPPNEGYDPYIPVTQHVPEQISRILVKLLAKKNANRYASANHLKKDLYQCITDKAFLSSTSAPSEPTFIVNRCSKLYERETAIEKIQSAYKNFSRQTFSEGLSSLLIISGAPGTGKSALCKTLIPLVWENNGAWYQDTFSQTPELPLALFGRLISHFLRIMHQKFPNELENQLKQMVYRGLRCPAFLPELIPALNDLSAILFLNSKPSQQETLSAQSFLISLFQMLAKTFHPMALCLKNIHRADQESLRLLEKLLTRSGFSFFIIGTCPKETDHPVNTLIHNCDTHYVNHYSISVENVSEYALNQKIKDMWNSSLDWLSPMIYEKTNGNPRASINLIDYIWRQTRLEKNLTPSKVSDLLNAELPYCSDFQYLNPTERDCLQLISGIGISWDFQTAYEISELTASEMESLIQKACRYGLISTGCQYQNQQKQDEWRFSSEWIHQYLYQSLSDDQRQKVHGKISLQIKRLNEPSTKMVYMIAKHRMLSHQNDLSKTDLARIYISAGSRASMAGLFLTSYEFFNTALSLFTEKDWESNHQMLFELACNTLKSANQIPLGHEIDRLAVLIQSKAKTTLEKLMVSECLVNVYFKNNQHEKVREVVYSGLHFINMQPDIPEFMRPFSVLKTALQYRNFQKLDIASILSDKDLLHTLTIRLIMFYVRCAPESKNKQLSGYIAKAIQQMQIKHPTTDAAYLWIMFARFFVDRKGLSAIGLHWARMGQTIIDSLTDLELQEETRLIYHWYIDHRSQASHQLLSHLKETIHRCVTRGFETRAAQASEYFLFLSLISGSPLKTILAQIHEISLHFRGRLIETTYTAMCRQAVLNLISGITPPHILTGQAFDEKSAFETMMQNNDIYGLFYLHTLKLILSVLFRNKKKSLILAEKTMTNIHVARGTPLENVVHFYSALAHTDNYASAGPAEQRLFRKKINGHVRLLRKWAMLCPENASHRYYLVLAEQASQLKLNKDISELYDKAISTAKANQHYHEYGLANERAGVFYAKHEKEKLSRAYIEDAYHAYAKWGGERKAGEYVKQEKVFKTNEDIQSSVWPITVKGRPSQLPGLQQIASAKNRDDDDIWEISQSFCTLLKFEKLLDTIIKTVLLHSGANKGCLVLKKNQSWFVTAHLNMDTQERYFITSEPMETSAQICLPIARQVLQSQSPICLWDAGKQGEFQYDSYIRENAPRSLLCIPVSYASQVSGLLYLENSRLTGLFTADRVKRLQIIASQAAIAIKNAQLVDSQESIVKDRATDLNLTVHQLSSAIQDLEARSREMMLLNQLSDALHICHTENDSYDVLQSFARKLFPGDQGILWIADNNNFNIATTWGKISPQKSTLTTNSCRCFNQQNMLFVEDVGEHPRCQSCGPADGHIYLCIPLKNQSSGMGVLHFQFGMQQPRIFDDTFTRRLESRRMLICRMIEHYALSLANLRLREALKHESRHDPLTGLFNRRHMQKMLKSAYEKAIKNKHNLGIVMIDIDHFKSFNDTYGHDTGDEVLKHLGAYLKKKMSSTLQPCRYGGEEFLLMCPNLTSEALFQTAEMIRKGIMNDIKVPYKDQLLDVTASLGAAFFPQHGGDMTSVIQCADSALYDAKKNGRNQVQMGKVDL